MNQLALGDFAPELLPELDQYHSPSKLCRRMVGYAGVLPGMRVLEPNAGAGNIVRELVAVGAEVTAVEIDPRWCKVLRDEFKDVEIVEANFLEWQAPDRYHLVVMNPPLTDGVGPTHVRHALRCAHRAVSVLQARDLHGVERYAELWAECDLAGEVKLVRRPAYAGTGGQIETVVVDARRRGSYSGPQTIVHWCDSWN